MTTLIELTKVQHGNTFELVRWCALARNEKHARPFCRLLHVSESGAEAAVYAADGHRLHRVKVSADTLAPGRYRVLKSTKGALQLLEHTDDEPGAALLMEVVMQYFTTSAPAGALEVGNCGKLASGKVDTLSNVYATLVRAYGLPGEHDRGLSLSFDYFRDALSYVDAHTWHVWHDTGTQAFRFSAGGAEAAVMPLRID